MDHDATFAGAADVDAAGWSVKGEGAANMVLAYNGDRPDLVRGESGDVAAGLRCAMGS